MKFDPFHDFDTRGYLRNAFGEKDPDIVRHLEHSCFIAGISEAFRYLSAIPNIRYHDVLHTHKLLFRDLYPWAGQNRLQTAPDIAVSKGSVLFAHPKDAEAAVDYALKIGSNKAVMANQPGEVMGYLAYGHPFLDGNGRTIMVVHAELAERAGISIHWAATSKSAYLAALSEEIDHPGKGHLDAYLKPFMREPIGVEQMEGNITGTHGLDGRANVSADENTVLGNVSASELKARYEEHRLRRRETGER